MTDNSHNDPIVTTTFGKIKGKSIISVYDDFYYSFERIPYAEPPLNLLRFQDPQPMTSSWNPLILDCTQKANKPIQKNPITHLVEGSEDCLYLNIYVKELHSKNPLPVMVFIPGGAFEKGDASRELHGPDYFMKQDVILAVIGYRLGPLGFLSLKDPNLAIPGNAGLKDQLLALQWIQKNICHFNGNAKNITLFGESAGSASAQYLMLCPLAQGLFQKVILQSGVVLCPWAMSRAENLAYRLAERNGYTGRMEDEGLILEFLRKLTADQLMLPYLLTPEENLNDIMCAFGPVVETYKTNGCIIPQQPLDMLVNAWGNELPIMIGFTSFEGLLMYGRVRLAPFLLTELQEHPEHLLPVALKRGRDRIQQQELGVMLKQIHFGDDDIAMEHILKYCDFASFKVFLHPILRCLKTRLTSQNTAATYLYRFDLDSPTFNHQRLKYCGPEVRGVAHADDLSYLFFGNFSWKLNTDDIDYKTIERMIDIWTTFANSSNPNCESLVNIGTWNPLNVSEVFDTEKGDLISLSCLNIGNELQIIELPELEKLKAWEKVYKSALS